jgi:hypothetical protein
MKKLKMLGLLAVAFVALTASAGASTASASVLCKTNANTETCPEPYFAGQALEATQTGGTSILEAPGGTVLDTCTGSTLKGKTTNSGGSSEAVKASVESLSWSGCTRTTDTLKTGSLEFDWIAGTDNGTLTASGTEWTVETIFGSCTYGFGAGTDLGTVTGGSPATITIATSIKKISGPCPESTTWTASYTFTEPKPLYVASAGSGATATTLTTSLSGEEKSGEEITVNEGSKVKDTATLGGTNASKATGTVKYKVYADKECKELVTSAGEVTVTGGSIPASEEKALEAGRLYYWQAEYSGDSKNLASTSACGKEVLTVKAVTLLSGTLSAEEAEELIEGEEITVYLGAKVKDKDSLGGTNHATATGAVTYKVYADNECEELVAEAGEVSVEAGEVPVSEEVELEEGTYYWQSKYSGDALHQASESTCGGEVLQMAARTFRANGELPFTIVGKQEAMKPAVFEFGKGRLECTGATTYFSAPFPGELAAIEVDPKYIGCTGLGFEIEEVKPEGCLWTLKPRFPEGPTAWESKTFLKCPPGNTLKVLSREVGNPEIMCEVTVPGQEAQSLRLENIMNGKQRLLLVTPSINNLTFKVMVNEGCNLPEADKEKSYGGGELTGKYRLEVEGAKDFFIA